VQLVQNQLQNLLDKDWGPKPPEPEVDSFEAQTDLTHLETLGWALPLEESARAQILFDRLAVYFDSGFCFHSSPEKVNLGWNNWRLDGAFHRGKLYPLLPQDRECRVALPQMTLLEVRRLKPNFLLGELKLPEDLAGSKTSALVVRPSDERLWIFFSSLPDLFLKTHLMKIHEECLRLLSDFPLGEAPVSP